MRLTDLQSDWDQLGRLDPLWAVLTRPDKQGGKWELEEFLQTGRNEVARVIEDLDALGATPERRRALDFGCGVGRVTQALADMFHEVIGVDIAPSMVEMASKLNRRGERCSFVLNSEDNLRIFPDGHFDFVYSNITLQHMPPRYMQRYLREFLRVLKPGAVSVFQIPAPSTVTLRQKLRRLIPQPVRERLLKFISFGKRPRMRMFWMEPSHVIDCIATGGGAVIERRADPSAGHRWASVRYYVVRASPD